MGIQNQFPNSHSDGNPKSTRKCTTTWKPQIDTNSQMQIPNPLPKLSSLWKLQINPRPYENPKHTPSPHPVETPKSPSCRRESQISPQNPYPGKNLKSTLKLLAGENPRSKPILTKMPNPSMLVGIPHPCMQIPICKETPNSLPCR